MNENPIPASSALKGLAWLGPRIPYPGAFKGDTFPICWADDDRQYSSAGDTVSEAKKDGLMVVALEGGPLDYRIDVVNPMPDFLGWGGHGLKPTGMLCSKGILYLFAHNLGKRTELNMEKCHGYDAQVFRSGDKGRTWEPELASAEKSPMFPGRDFGSPCFVNFGKDNEGAVDGFVYSLSGQGWGNGNALRIGRAPADRIMDRGAWEFVGGFDPRLAPVWVPDASSAVPVLEDPGFMGYPEAVYVASIRRYVLFGWRFKVERPDKYSPDDGSELAVYEAPRPWGPYALVAKMDWENPEVTPYNPRLPLKWFDAERLEGYLLFSGSWRNGGSSEYYRAQIRKFKLERA